MARNFISETDRARVGAAIQAAEQNTSGEIVAVVTETSDDYHFIPLLWAALLALILPLPLIYLTKLPVQQIYALQILAFALMAAAVQWWPLRFALVPRFVKHARAHRNAVDQFLAQNLHTTEARTGVLIFVSVAEHFSEVIADEGIYQKVPEGTWEAVVDGLNAEIRKGNAADGLVWAVAECGRLLEQHFPPGMVDENELPNHLIIL